MSWSKSYECWNQVEYLDLELKKLLVVVEGNEQLLEDFFYKNLEFGIGGMRGEIGLGINRMNIYMVCKVFVGFVVYIVKYGEDVKKRGVVIVYDFCYKFFEFVMEVVKIFVF